MKFKMGGESGGIKTNFGNLGKNKKIALIVIGGIIGLLLLVMLFSGGSDETTIDGSDFENNETEQNSSIFTPPPPPPFEFDENAFEDDVEQNATKADDESKSVEVDSKFDISKFELEEPKQEAIQQTIENNQSEVFDTQKIEPQIIQEPKEEAVKNEIVEAKPSQIQNQEPQQKPQTPQEKILPVENGLSMSQRGIPPEKIVEVIDSVSNAEFKCKCDCPVCPTDTNNNAYNQPQPPLPPQNNAYNNADCANGGYSNGQNANGYPNANTNNGNNLNGRARVEIRPDDMIIYLKAKQPFMRFDGKNLVFENRTYANGDIFKGWWKIEHTNNVYARFFDDLSGYAYNLRFLENQGGTK